MCGIIAFIAKDNKSINAGRHLVEQYQEQIHRGSEGFGLIEIFKDKIEIHRAVEPVKALMDTRLTQSSIPIFHHRKPTSTENTMLQTHPFMVEHDELEFDYCVVHNGVLKNEDELFKLHTENLGYAYSTFIKTKEKNYSQSNTSWAKDKSFNDSETLAIEVARYFDGQTREIGAIGTIAFMAVKIDKKTKQPVEIIWGRNSGNPLECLQKDEGVLLASIINSDYAETITENTFEVIDLQRYFNARKPIDVYKEIEAFDLKFHEKPEPKRVAASNEIIQRSLTREYLQMGFGSKKESTAKANFQEDEDDWGEEATNYACANDDYRTKREIAFDTMGERAADEVGKELLEFFKDLAYTDMTDEEIMLVANSVNDLLLEKVETARDHVRPHFDKQEETEMNTMMEEAQEDIQDHEQSLAEKIEESEQNYEHIVS